MGIYQVLFWGWETNKATVSGEVGSLTRAFGEVTDGGIHPMKHRVLPTSPQLSKGGGKDPEIRGRETGGCQRRS